MLRVALRVAQCVAIACVLTATVPARAVEVPVPAFLLNTATTPSLTDVCDAIAEVLSDHPEVAAVRQAPDGRLALYLRSGDASLRIAPMLLHERLQSIHDRDIRETIVEGWLMDVMERIDRVASQTRPADADFSDPYRPSRN